MLFAFDRLRQEENLARQIDQAIVFDRMLFFLPL
jgi:hypothetical protein